MAHNRLKSLTDITLRMPTTSMAVTLLGVTSLLGCGNSASQPARGSAPLQIVRQAVEKEEQQISADRLVTHKTHSSSTTNRDDARAEQLFESLVSPNSDDFDWDQTHQKLLDEKESAVRVLARKLVEGNDVERELAATTLALIGPKAGEASEALSLALKDELPFVRANAAAALVQLPERASQAVPALIELLHSEHVQLRQMAAVNLNAAGLSSHTDLSGLKRTLVEEESSEVLTPVVELLGRIGRPAEFALPELQRIATERPGELGTAANTAIQLISAESPISDD